MPPKARLFLALLAACFVGVAAARRRHSRGMAALRAAAGGSYRAPADRGRALAKAVAYARSMRYTPYDPFMGKYDDALGKLGFVVCIDVPLRSYMSAGLAMPALLKESAAENPDWFRIGPDNPPSSPFFYRRVRNYSDLFANHPSLTTSASPNPGDWAFYGRWHIALVSDVLPDGSYRLVEAAGRPEGVLERGGAEMTRDWGPPSFFGRLKDCRAAGSARLSPCPASSACAPSFSASAAPEGPRRCGPT